MTTKTLAALAFAAIPSLAALATTASAYTCTTHRHGYGNNQTCTTTCD
jgi:hypothetical protein